MITDFRVLQIFLEPITGGVSEVSFRESGPPHFHCTCPGFVTACTHTAFVAAKLRANGGAYPFPKVNPEQLAEAFLGSPEDFRSFVLHHGIPELG